MQEFSVKDYLESRVDYDTLKRSGVYRFRIQNAWLYIGKADNLLGRIRGHLQSGGGKIFGFMSHPCFMHIIVDVIYVPKAELAETELQHIHELSPLLNVGVLPEIDKTISLWDSICDEHGWFNPFQDEVMRRSLGKRPKNFYSRSNYSDPRKGKTGLPYISQAKSREYAQQVLMPVLTELRAEGHSLVDCAGKMNDMGLKTVRGAPLDSDKLAQLWRRYNTN